MEKNGLEHPRFYFRPGILMVFVLAFIIFVYINSSRPSGTWTDSLSWSRKHTKMATHSTTAGRRLSNQTIISPYLVAYPHDYYFILNESARCPSERPYLVLMVPVAPKDRASRDVIRSTWGNETTVLGKTVRLFFMLGLPGINGREQTQEEIFEESREHHDLLQSDFLDSYQNLTIKTLMILKWLSTYCSDVSYALKADTDMFVNVRNLVKMLLKAPKKNYMTGIVAKNGTASRNPKSKWYLPVDVFPGNRFPPYAMGQAYAFSLDLLSKLLEAAKHVKAIYIEDAYVGLCMKHLGIRHTEPPSRSLFNLYLRYPQSRCFYSKIISVILRSREQIQEIWRNLKKPGPAC